MARRLPVILVLISLAGFVHSKVAAQQPFTTDDSDVTELHHFHFQFSNQYDLLQRQERPTLDQNTADFELDYGLLPNLEVGVELPYISFINSADTIPRSVSGIGDMNFSSKYNLHKEHEHSFWPAMSVAMNIEFPTGSVSRQLGSGLTDYYVNGVLQKSLTKVTKLRLNGGILFAGNETTGLLGIKARGTVLTASGSLVKEINPKLQLGAELAGAAQGNLELDKGQFEGRVGGNYQFAKRATLDFSVVAGKFIASPRLGALLGISIDF